MRKLDKLDLIFYSLLAIIALLCITIAVIVMTENENDYDVLYAEDIVNNCKDKNLEQTTLCIRNNIATIFEYNISTVGTKLTFDELKESGGVCTHYSWLYVNTARALGYSADHYIVDMRNKSADHMMATISDETGYCLVDQSMSPFCVKIK